MARRSKKTETTKAAPTASDGFTTFSVRLNDQQRDLLMQAAGLRGWTPTQLVRTAALERAVSICNTALPRSFDYKGLASKLAEGWFSPRPFEYLLTGEDLERIHYRNPDEPASLEVVAPPQPLHLVFELKRAAAEAGTEFLHLLVEFAEGFTASSRSDLPAPIDPKTLIGRED